MSKFINPFTDVGFKRIFCGCYHSAQITQDKHRETQKTRLINKVLM